jgi:CubicO group peptidase (beta-lactamase class C family)
VRANKQVKTYLPNAAEPASSACMAKPLERPTAEDHYSNMGFSILAAVVEEISGTTWETYLREHIWVPLGMRHTGIASFANTKRTDFAAGYLNDKPQGVISDEIVKLRGADWNIKGNGGIQSTAIDMERFWRGLTARLSGISRDAVRGMITPHDPIAGEAWEGYGLAVRSNSAGKPFRIGHSGSDGTPSPGEIIGLLTLRAFLLFDAIEYFFPMHARSLRLRRFQARMRVEPAID